MKIVYFVVNGRASIEDKSRSDLFRKDGHKCIFSNGSVPYGFEDSCDAVYLSADFPHVENWALSNGIEVMKPEPEPAVAAEQEPVKEVKINADALSEDSEKAEEEVKHRRQRRTKPAANDVV